MAELPPQPTPKAEPPTPAPGGPDALPVDPDGLGQPRDLEPEHNPAVEGMPAEVAQTEPPQTEPTEATDEGTGEGTGEGTDEAAEDHDAGDQPQQEQPG